MWLKRQTKKRIAYLAQINSNNANNFNKNIKKSKELDELIKQWLSYEDVGTELFYKKAISFTKNCPAYHCTLGFEHPALKPYQAVFQREVPKNKDKLVNTLRADPDERRRGAAAFLLAHIRNGEELVNLLTPCMLDPSEGVRNNVMRVLGMTLLVVKPINFNMAPIIQALQSPVLTDRNKALCMLVPLGSEPKYANYIAKNAAESLMASLKMTQPNLHSTAHVVLRVISGKDYGDHEYDAWQNWLLEQGKV